MASVECTIIIFKKCNTNYKIIEEYETEIIDYSNDGYVIKKKLRVKTGEPKPESYKIKLEFNNDWNYSNVSNNISDDEFKYMIAKYNIEKNYIENDKKLNSNKYDFKFIEYIKFRKPKEWRKIKIKDYFEFVTNYKGYQVQKSKPGIYPLITRSGVNNGITKYIDEYSLDGDYITLAPSGTTGATFHQTGKFAVDNNLKVLKLRENVDMKIDLDLFVLLCTYILTKKYNYNNGLTIEKINNTIIYYPIFE